MHPTFIVALFTTAKIERQPKCSTTVEQMKMWLVHIYKNITRPQNRRKLNKVDGLREYHAKTSKSDTERQTLYVITHCCSVTKSSPTL